MKAVEEKVVAFLADSPASSSKDIHLNALPELSYATVKRILNGLLAQHFILAEGNGKGTKYSLSESFRLLKPINVDQYFEKEIDERRIFKTFNFNLLNDHLLDLALFNAEEMDHLARLQGVFQHNTEKLSHTQYAKELERLAIDLSWKSSQMEGNTYSLLETELLLREQQTASGKTKDEATMLLNHKKAIDFVIAHTDYLQPLRLDRIEDIHSLLMLDLGVNRNLRNHRVGISGTNYTPLDNQFQIKEALEQMCELVNAKENVFEKALLVLLLISYIQPFEDGNKRTARIVSNSILLHHRHCPISFRTVDSIEYKKAMLIFYEQNNVSAFKELFIAQFEFAVNTYF